MAARRLRCVLASLLVACGLGTALASSQWEVTELRMPGIQPKRVCISAILGYREIVPLRY